MLQEMNCFTQVTNEPFSLISYRLPWWILVRLAIKFQPMLATTAGNSCEGLQNMNFCSINKTCYRHTHSFSQNNTDTHSWGDVKDLGGGTLCSPSRAMNLLKQPVCELGVAYAILYL